MTTGEKLKKSLGLEKFKSVRMARVLFSPLKLFFIWYDSSRPFMPITTARVKRYPNTAMIYHGSNLYHEDENYFTFAPLIDIEDFSGIMQNAMFITVDLAGNNLIKKNSFTEKSIVAKLNEFVTMADLMDTGNISDFTTDFRKDRTTIMGGENTTAKLIDVSLNELDNSVTFYFLTTATEYKPGKKLRRPPEKRYKLPKKKTDPESLSLEPNPEKLYEIQIKVLDFFKWLDAQKEGISILTTKHIKEIFDVSNIQVFSSSPAWHWQGFSYWMSQLDASIYPTDIAPKRWNHYHGDGQAFLDKHLYGLIRQIKFYYGPMSSMLTKRLKDKGFI